MTHPVCITDTGGDRATGYTMSTKILRTPRGLLLTWIDADCQNRWALADAVTGQLKEQGTLGSPRADNHCGAALALDGNTAHAVLGAHHDTLDHYTLDLNTCAGWRHRAALPDHATYPALVSGPQGSLFLAYRSEGTPFTLNTRRFDGENWSAPSVRVMADKPGYIYWTNGLARGADGILHLVFGNTRVLESGDFQFSASHLYSPDEGTTWFSDGLGEAAGSLSARDLPLLTPVDDPDRVEKQKDFNGTPGPSHSNYLQIHLSNPVVDSAGRLHAVLHNGLNGQADLLTRSPAGEWSGRPLNPLLTGPAKGRRIHLQSSLGLAAGDELHIALMIRPEGEDANHWGPAGTFIARIILPEAGEGPSRMEIPAPGAPDCASWLPALEHPCPPGLPEFPAMLFTRGRNAGGFSQNTNRVETRVFLETGAGARGVSA